jgi:hypothetical protein
MNAVAFNRENSMRRQLFGALVATGLSAIVGNADAALYWTQWVSEENGGPQAFCTNWDESAVGFGCSGNYCDNVRLLCETHANGMTMDPASQKFTAWFSEEGALPPGIESNQPTPNQGVCRYFIPGTIDSFRPGVVSGVRCSGSFCDNTQLECELPVKFNSSGTAVPATANSCHSVGPISEEQGSVDFGPNQYIYSVTCNGSFCDNKTFTVCNYTAPF